MQFKHIELCVNALYQPPSRNNIMATTIPNLEAVRRICYQMNVSFCYLINNKNYEFVELYTDVKEEESSKFTRELQSWCGMKFKVYTEAQSPERINFYKNKGKKIYPLE